MYVFLFNSYARRLSSKVQSHVTFVCLNMKMIRFSRSSNVSTDSPTAILIGILRIEKEKFLVVVRHRHTLAYNLFKVTHFSTHFALIAMPLYSSNKRSSEYVVYVVNFTMHSTLILRIIPRHLLITKF